MGKTAAKAVIAGVYISKHRSDKEYILSEHKIRVYRPPKNYIKLTTINPVFCPQIVGWSYISCKKTEILHIIKMAYSSFK